MESGKTIRQIADEIGVTKQAVHQKRKSKDYEERLRKFTKTIDGVVYISSEGENIIKSAFSSIDNSKEVYTSFRQESVNENSELYSVLKTTIEVLEKQLSVKDKQIDELNERLSEAHKMADQAQKLHGADKVIELKEPALIEEKYKRRFWDRFKK